MPELQALGAEYAAALLAFERTNRAYFARSISDRGDDFFNRFSERLDALLADQAAGTTACYVLVEQSGSIVGRFNLYDIDGVTADVGYRVAERVAGRGVATEALAQLCRLAAQRHGLRTLNACVSDRNAASRRVLVKTGFVRVGRADPADLGGKSGDRFRRDLAGV